MDNPHKNENLKALSFLNPTNVIKKDIASIVPLAVTFPNLINHNDMTCLDREWRHLQAMDIEKYADVTNILDFWRNISFLKKGDNSPMFPTLTTFVKKLLCLPHSSAAVERIFSCINLIKTKQRNRLNVSTLAGLLYAKKKINGSSCFTIPIEESVLRKFNQDMYEFKSQARADSDSD